MPRLLRPHIPVEVRCRVVLRQLGEMWPDRLIKEARACSLGLGHVLDEKLAALAELLDCSVQDLRLDHNPALGARVKVLRKGEHVDYRPKANDPLHLEYRPHGKTFERSHLIKTNVRGDHGQHPDRVLIKKMRKLERKVKKKRAVRAMPRRHVRKVAGKPVNAFKAMLGPARTFQPRPMRSANRWPAKGSQKFGNRSKRR